MSKPPLRIRIKHDLWSRFGSATLSGLYAEARLADSRGEDGRYDDANASHDLSKVILEIEQTSYDYRKNNGGPAEMIVPEFMPMCLIKDILSMTRKHKIDVKVETVEIHEEPKI